MKATPEQLLRELEHIRSQVVELTEQQSEQRWKEDLALRAIVEGTAGAVGGEFFRSLVKHLATAMGVRYAFVAEFADSDQRVRTLAFWNGAVWLPNFEYELAGTPCQEVFAGSLCHHPDRIQELFPQDAPLVELGARGYLGVPLLAIDDRVLGHLAVMDTEPMPPEPRGLSIFRIFANRARAELERLRAERAVEEASQNLERQVEERTRELARSEQECRSLLAINQAVARHLGRHELVRSLAATLRSYVPVERMGMMLANPGDARVSLYALYSADAATRLAEDQTFARAGSAAAWVLENRRAFVASTPADLEGRFPKTHRAVLGEGMQSLCVLPLSSANRCVAALFMQAREPGAYDQSRLGFLEEMAAAIAVALDNCLAYEEIARLKDRLSAENVYLQEEIESLHGFKEIVGDSPALLELLELVAKVAPTDATVLLFGETGTGKELIARALHNRSPRNERPLVKVNCAAIAAGLVESELFGHTKGAFTGASEAREGRFVLADGGTIFLDEIAEIPAPTQSKLLRVLQERELEPVGSNQAIKVDVRVIAATNRDLEAEVERGRFRSDLFYRLNVLPIRVPPLRERRADIAKLAAFFMRRHTKACGKDLSSVSRASLDALEHYDWPGNVRELQNVIERAVVLSHGPRLELGGDLLPLESRGSAGVSPQSPAATPPTASVFATLEELQRRHIVAALERTAGVIDGPRGAARLLALHPNTLRSRIKKLGIKSEPHEIS